MPYNGAIMESTMSYFNEKIEKKQTVFLVWPSEADIRKKRISVLTPIGAALIGLSEGASIDWETNNGQIRQLTILKVKN